MRLSERGHWWEFFAQIEILLRKKAPIKVGHGGALHKLSA